MVPGIAQPLSLSSSVSVSPESLCLESPWPFASSPWFEKKFISVSLATTFASSHFQWSRASSPKKFQTPTVFIEYSIVNFCMPLFQSSCPIQPFLYLFPNPRQGPFCIFFFLPLPLALSSPFIWYMWPLYRDYLLLPRLTIYLFYNDYALLEEMLCLFIFIFPLTYVTFD